jgi:outer membrane lipoprotein
MGKHRCGGKLVLTLILLLFYGSLDGCAPTFSRQLQQGASPPGSFQELVEHGAGHEGELVILGGYILQTSNEPDGSLLSILQAPLDSRDEPKSQDLSEGRFLVRTKEFLDPEIYGKGRKISVAGKVSGILPQPLGNRLYQYPVVGAEELHLWPKEERYTRPYWDYWHYPSYPYHYRPYPWWF